MKNQLIITLFCIIIASCGKNTEQRLITTEYKLNCFTVKGYNSFECLGSGIRCNYAAWSDNVMTCSTTIPQLIEGE